MEQNRKDNFAQQAPAKKNDVGKASTATTRPEIDLPLKGGRSDADLANQGKVKKDQRIEPDKKSTR